MPLPHPPAVTALRRRRQARLNGLKEAMWVRTRLRRLRTAIRPGGPPESQRPLLHCQGPERAWRASPSGLRSGENQTHHRPKGRWQSVRSLTAQEAPVNPHNASPTVAPPRIPLESSSERRSHVVRARRGCADSITPLAWHVPASLDDLAVPARPAQGFPIRQGDGFTWRFTVDGNPAGRQRKKRRRKPECARYGGLESRRLRDKPGLPARPMAAESSPYIGCTTPFLLTLRVRRNVQATD